MTNDDEIPVIELTPAQDPSINPDGTENLVQDPFEDQDKKFAKTNKRTPRQRDADYEQIKKLIFEHKDIGDIVSILNQTRPYTLSVAQVRIDIAKLERRFKDRHDKPKSVKRAIEREWIHYLEAEAQQAWVRSQQNAESTKIEIEDSGEGRGKTKRTKSSEKQVGDARFLDAMIRLSELRIRLEGLAATQEEMVSRSENSGVDIQRLREAYEKTMIAKLSAKLVPQIEDKL